MINKRLAICAMVLGVLTSWTYSYVCSYSGAPGSCNDVSCGIGCDITDISTPSWHCSTQWNLGVSYCCRCADSDTICDCIFGQGTGKDRTKYQDDDVICNPNPRFCY